MDTTTLKDIIENLSLSADNQIYLLREALKSSESAQKIKLFSEQKMQQVENQVTDICAKNMPNIALNNQKILKIFDNINNLNHNIVSVDTEITKHSCQLINLQKNITVMKLEYANVQSLTEILEIIVPALEVFDNLKQDLINHAYIISIDNLLKLESEYLPKITNYSFAKKIASEIPSIKHKITSYAINEAKDFLATARLHEIRVGENFYKLIDSKSATFYLETKEYIDLSTLLTCHYVHSVLGILQQFTDYYRPQRRAQLKLCVMWTSNDLDLDALNDYFKKIVGFFCIEDSIIQTIKGLVDISFIQIMWDEACHAIYETVKKFLAKDSSNKVLVRVKLNFKYLFKLAEFLNLSKLSLTEIIEQLRSVYETRLASKSKMEFAKMIMLYDFELVKVPSVAKFKFEALMEKPDEFPAIMPFTQFAIILSKICEEFAKQIIKFSEGIYSNNSDVYIIVMESIKNLFSFYLPSAFTGEFFERLNFEQFLQIISDTIFFLNHIHRFEIKAAQMCKSVISQKMSVFTPETLIYEIFKIFREEFKKRISGKLSHILQNTDFSSESELNNMTIEIDALTEVLLKVFNDASIFIKVYFLKRFPETLNSELRKCFKKFLTKRSISYLTIFYIDKSIGSTMKKIEDASDEEGLLKNTNGFLRPLKLVTATVSNWEWDKLIEKLKADENLLSKDYKKLLNFLIHLLDKSTVPENLCDPEKIAAELENYSKIILN